jgi:hypothetical protein
LLSREVDETKQLNLEFRENALFSEKLMPLKTSSLFLWLGGEEAEKKGAPK